MKEKLNNKIGNTQKFIGFLIYFLNTEIGENLHCSFLHKKKTGRRVHTPSSTQSSLWLAIPVFVPLYS